MPPYVSLSEVKAHLRITGTTFDEFITQMVPALSELCDDLTGRTFAKLGAGFETHGLTVRYQLTNLKRGVILPEWPIVSIVGITHGTTALPATNYRVAKRTGYIQFTDTVGNPTDLAGNIDVTAVMGFSVVPRQVALAVIRALSYIKQRADEEGLGSELIGPQQTTWRATLDRDSNDLHDIMLTHIGRFELDNLTMLEEGEIF